MKLKSLICKLVGHKSIKVWEHSFDDDKKKVMSSIYRCERCYKYTVNDKVSVGNDVIYGDKIVNQDGNGSYDIDRYPFDELDKIVLSQRPA